MGSLQRPCVCSDHGPVSQLVAEPSVARGGIAAVVCAYSDDRRDALATSVASLGAQRHPLAEVIVVVDHNEGLLAWARERFPAAVVVANSQPRGLSGARESGIAAATGDIVAFIDDDAAAEPDWSERLARHYGDAQVLAVGGAILPEWEGGRPSWFPDEFDWVVGCTYRGMPETASPVRNLIGCNMSFRREIFAPAGGFRVGIGRVDAVPVGGEETDLCIRVHQTFPEGIILYDPVARVRHLVPRSRASRRYFVARCFEEGRSKALVVAFVGSESGLSSERAYTTRTLPIGVLRNVAGAIRHRDGSGLTRAGMLVAGLGVTTVGYAVGQLSRHRQPASRRLA